MALIDDLKAAQADILDSLSAIGVSVGNIGTDVDTLLTLIQTPNPDLTEVVAAANQIKERATAVKDALAVIDKKYPTA